MWVARLSKSRFNPQVFYTICFCSTVLVLWCQRIHVKYYMGWCCGILVEMFLSGVECCSQILPRITHQGDTVIAIESLAIILFTRFRGVVWCVEHFTMTGHMLVIPCLPDQVRWTLSATIWDLCMKKSDSFDVCSTTGDTVREFARHCKIAWTVWV